MDQGDDCKWTLRVRGLSKWNGFWLNILFSECMCDMKEIRSGAVIKLKIVMGPTVRAWLRR